ncbi:hypothetical protein GL4_3229 [Methyloceanibacter caenitepidi]|uniref:Uncharacterized protein n=1 Tax=Methyloceanibacter caenitepidi TaxID=1384459 RepID=A0A0A8K6W1_9HYPH|nr:hypothetical protein GL4_3229 [Methyloceanibacter caenitepidi]
MLLDWQSIAAHLYDKPQKRESVSWRAPIGDSEVEALDRRRKIHA